MAPDDLLTVDNFPSGEASVSPDDLLTVDNFPSAEASAIPDVPVDGGGSMAPASTASTSASSSSAGRPPLPSRSPASWASSR